MEHREIVVINLILKFDCLKSGIEVYIKKKLLKLFSFSFFLKLFLVHKQKVKTVTNTMTRLPKH